jgi:2-polyprenyl-6-methoxyphenol hydroxylase-like FAD-dependent oxidoreductase
MLDIHDYNGQLAIEAAGLMDKFRGLVLEGRQAMRVLDRDGAVLFEKADDGTGGRPEVQRAELRQMLLDSLPAGTVRWGRKVSSVRVLGAAARVAQEFDGWAPELTALITDGDTAPVQRPHFTLPHGHQWDRVPGVTLVGDAAHLTAPNGEGANLAMLDGAELGQALAAQPEDIEAALAAFEQAMFVRSAEVAAETEAADDLTLQDMIDFFNRAEA